MIIISKQIIILFNLFLLVNCLFPQEKFTPLLKDEHFKLSYQNIMTDTFDNDKQLIIVDVDRIIDIYHFGIIPNELGTEWYYYGNKIYFLKESKSKSELKRLFLCDGDAGEFKYIADVTKSYTVSETGNIIVYVSTQEKNPDIIFKDSNNKIIKIIDGNEILISNNIREKIANLSVNIIYDSKENRLLFAYLNRLAGFVDLNTMKTTVLKGDKLDDFIEQYFPDILQ